MFADDIALVSEMVAKYGPVTPPFVECGGLEDPVIADYTMSIIAMARVFNVAFETDDQRDAAVRQAQMCRYIQIHRPLDSALPGYVCEDPATGGVPIEALADKYPRGIGTAVLLSVLEHVDNPFVAIDRLHGAMKPGGLVIVSVPFTFPYHAECGQDCWRFTDTGLRHVLGDAGRWEVLQAGRRLDIPAEAGVIDVKSGRAQIIQSAYITARAVG